MAGVVAIRVRKRANRHRSNLASPTALAHRLRSPIPIMIKQVIAAFFFLVAIVSTGFAAERKMLTDLPTAIETATEKNKLIFIKYGREACGNCRSLKTLINERKVKLFDSEFVLVDLNCDDTAVAREFNGKYRSLLKDAKTLPFVVVAKSDGTPIAAISSYNDAKAYNKFIADAKKQAKTTS